ncbi:MAG: hypothetical protein R3B40_23315 [Polyangiales bacterium]|nr:hypothetical protein [Myxococcales bacterium]MCB9661448.1 hypothetical protein [Sandaracinaceae bacterium]
MSELLARAPDLDRTVDGSRMLLWLRSDLVVSRIEGHFSRALAEALVEHSEPLIRRSGAFVGLHDWTEMPSFDILVPPRLAAWTIGLLPHIARIVIATGHPLVSMAVRTTNLTIKRIEHLDSREAWLDVVRRAT